MAQLVEELFGGDNIELFLLLTQSFSVIFLGNFREYSFSRLINKISGRVHVSTVQDQPQIPH